MDTTRVLCPYEAFQCILRHLYHLAAARGALIKMWKVTDPNRSSSKHEIFDDGKYG
jgi:hypothetical protein